MIGLILKLILFPLAVLATSYFSPNIHYSSFYQPVIVGAVIAVIGHLAEFPLLKRGTPWISTVIDFLVATPEVYYSQLLFSGSQITWMGAAMTGLLIAVADTPVHFYLVETGKTQKHSE